MRVELKNRKGQKIVALVEGETNTAGVGFVVHGLGAYKEQGTMTAAAKALLENGFVAIRFDTTNTLGESDGKYEDATLTNYYEDLQDVIKWATAQPFYREPFILIGSSLGGISCALFAEEYPEKVKGLAPIATVVSGRLSLESPEYKDNEVLEKWNQTGWLERESISKPGTIKRLKWSHMEDRLRYDLIPEAYKLKMPVLMVVGSEDQSCPPEHQRILYDAIPGRKEMHIVPGAAHVFRSEQELQILHDYLDQWIKSL